MGVTEGLAIAEESNGEAVPKLVYICSYRRPAAPMASNLSTNRRLPVLEHRRRSHVPRDLASEAELPESIPWRRIGASQSMWLLFAQPGLLAGRKVYFTRAFAPSLFLLHVQLESMQLLSPRTQLQPSSVIFRPCVSYSNVWDGEKERMAKIP